MGDLPKVLLLGDSIRMSYQPHVRQLLEGRAEVVGPVENCQYSLFTLSSIDRWLGECGTPDIVHWNNGLHDAGHNPERSPIQIPWEMYRDNLAFVLKRLVSITPRVIWATTTPPHPDRPFRETEWSWRNEEINPYDRAARELMEAHGVVINDLRKLVGDNVADFLSEDQIHLSAAGEWACARAAVSCISAFLPSEA